MTNKVISIVLSLYLILSMALASQPSQVNAATLAPKAIDGYTYQRTLSETVAVEGQKDQEANKAIGLAIVACFHSFTAGTVITALGLEGPNNEPIIQKKTLTKLITSLISAMGSQMMEI